MSVLRVYRSKVLKISPNLNRRHHCTLHSPYPLTIVVIITINTQETTSSMWVEDDSRTCRRSNRRRCRPSLRRSETSSRPHSSCRCSRTPGPTRVTNKQTNTFIACTTIMVQAIFRNTHDRHNESCVVLTNINQQHCFQNCFGCKVNASSYSQTGRGFWISKM